MACTIGSYYAKQEADKKLNYLGYIKEVKLGDKGAVLKVRSSLNDIVQPITTILVGASPELEFALYTMCFFTRPNNALPDFHGRIRVHDHREQGQLLWKGHSDIGVP